MQERPTKKELARGSHCKQFDLDRSCSKECRFVITNILSLVIFMNRDNYIFSSRKSTQTGGRKVGRQPEMHEAITQLTTELLEEVA